MTLVHRAQKGNQPISRRVDTISKQYQESDSEQNRQQDQDDNDGGGAPWES
ncbi:hypothetical protein GCM10022284_45730 [Streptomyces hundungensis]